MESSIIIFTIAMIFVLLILLIEEDCHKEKDEEKE